jgi:hypothetical protein
MLAVFLALALAGLASASEYMLETAPQVDRASAQKAATAAAAAGFDARVVRRFQLGRGWEYVVLVEHFPDEAQAQGAATRLARELGGKVSIFLVDDHKTVAVAAAPAAAPQGVASVQGPSALVALAREAHGGQSGGTHALARAGAVHFTFTRTVSIGASRSTVRHDYWRDASGRRLEVDTGGAGVDSLAIANAQGAWLASGGVVRTRDTGVLITAVDAFAPEAVLTLALDVHTLLGAPEVGQFRVLDGAEAGTRIGSGGDESEVGLSFVDVDPASGLLHGARYVTDGGPVQFEMRGWRPVGAGVLVPMEMRIRHPDGATEIVTVDRLEVLAGAPADTFARPSGS